ncbi:salivary lipid interacting protein, putative [Ixodes scapularis]|uniref:Salivary lipid interacting protein, putative n=1 Tax=Ixodes scapularis TaxID=6945 RepID=B7QHX2_IXOSC|nr:salivary lipid interacting protein, putative [Ixodes scapularis]|eukprot:XP_002414779.1 salivary lipid interacting protein, putative [Ixodes scapularis]
MLSTRNMVLLAGSALALLLVVPACVRGQDAPGEPTFRNFYNCTWAKGDPGEQAQAYLGGCGSEEICPLYRGSEAKLELQFSPRSDTSGVFRRIFGLFDKVLVPYGREVNVCNSTTSIDDNVRCSEESHGLRQGRLYRHSGAFLVKPFFPKVQLNVTVYLYDKSPQKVPVACVQIPVQIKDKDRS